MAGRKATKDLTGFTVNDNKPDQNQSQQPPVLLYLSDYRYGGCTTFTAHLLHILNRKYVFCLAKAFNKGVGDFGYGIQYQRKPIEFFAKAKKMFITDMYKNFNLLDNLNGKDITIVVHDPGEIFEENEPYIKNWNIIVIRKTMRDYLKRKYNINAKFLYHPFYPYNISANNSDEDEKEEGEGNTSHDGKTGAISISRIEPHKNIDTILRANKKMKKNHIKIYGLLNPSYVNCTLKKLDFDKYYHGMFDKSFGQVSAILNKSKFMIDLSEIPNDGGGTQYTFLEAIYNKSAIVLNRKWIESVDEKYRDFKEGYNCYAVSNEGELVELLNNSNNVDTTKVVKNAGKLMHRHINAAGEWSKCYFYNNLYSN